MDERTRPNMGVEEYLQEEDVQKRILKNMEHGHANATVSIGRAANLFGFTENQLRDWEEHELLKPIRLPGGQRQYSYTELDKLAIIRELMDARYAPGDIPTDIDDIWASLSLVGTRQRQMLGMNGNQAEALYIDDRVERTEKEFVWGYFVSRALRLSLTLIYQDVDTVAGIVLPLQGRGVSTNIHSTKDLPKVGLSLVGWLGQNTSFYAFVDPAPAFQYASDFRVLPLREGKKDSAIEASQQGNALEPLEDKTLIVVQRKTKPLAIPHKVMETVQRFLRLIYECEQEWLPAFSQGTRDLIIPATSFNDGANAPDIILNGLADMVVKLGGKTSQGEQCWQFCNILLSKDTKLPVQQRGLTLRAKSEDSPYKLGADLYPDETSIYLSLRAFQSGHIIYRPNIAEEDLTVVLRQVEGPIRSAIAVPIGGENGLPIGVLYVTSQAADAFSESEQRVLRIMSRIVEEQLMIYHTGQQVTRRLVDLVETPSVVDPLFNEFLSENEFISDIEKMLRDIKVSHRKREERAREEGLTLAKFDEVHKIKEQSEVVSFIAVDVDDLSKFANKFGDQMTRNLSREVGSRIQGQFRALIRKDEASKLYHIYADRFYLILKGIPLEEARKDAERLRNALKARYRVSAMRVSMDQPTPPGSMLVLDDVTGRLAVTSYYYWKLEEILLRYPEETAVAEVGAKIGRTLDYALKVAMDAGGNIVLTWDHKYSRFINSAELISSQEEITDYVGTH